MSDLTQGFSTPDLAISQDVARKAQSSWHILLAKHSSQQGEQVLQVYALLDSTTGCNNGAAYSGLPPPEFPTSCADSPQYELPLSLFMGALRVGPRRVQAERMLY